MASQKDPIHLPPLADSVGLWFPELSIDNYADHNRQSVMMSCSALE